MENIMQITPQYPDFGALLESVKESGRRMDENAARYYREQAERDALWKKEQAERDARWEKEREAADARMEKISKDTNKAIREMKDMFYGQWGRLVEALSKPAALALFKKEGVDIDRIYSEGSKAKQNGQDVMEIDVALCDTTTAVIVEVKSRCNIQDIDHFLSQMEHCKEWYSEFADKKLLVAVAAIDYTPGAEKYAQRKGLYVLKLTGEETFTMAVPAKPKAF